MVVDEVLLKDIRDAIAVPPVLVILKLAVVTKTFNLSPVPVVFIVSVAFLPVAIILPLPPIVVPAAVLVFTPKDVEPEVPALIFPNEGLAKVQLVTVIAAGALFIGKRKISAIMARCSFIAELRC